jgi:hypothetical protein
MILPVLPLLLHGAALSLSLPPDERVVMVTDFDRLRIDGPFTVEVAPGPPSVTLIGTPQALDQVSAKVSAHTLVINAGLRSYQSDAGKLAGTAKVRVTVPSLRFVIANGGTQLSIAELRGDRVELAVNGAGNLTVARVEVQDLGATLSGVGTMALAGTALHSRVRLYGGSSFDGSKLDTAEAVLVSGTTGELSLGVRYTAQISATSAGLVRVLGNPKCAVLGSGPVECGDIERRGEGD